MDYFASKDKHPTNDSSSEINSLYSTTAASQLTRSSGIQQPPKPDPDHEYFVHQLLSENIPYNDIQENSEVFSIKDLKVKKWKSEWDDKIDYTETNNRPPWLFNEFIKENFEKNRDETKMMLMKEFWKEVASFKRSVNEMGLSKFQKIVFLNSFEAIKNDDQECDLFLLEFSKYRQNLSINNIKERTQDFQSKYKQSIWTSVTNIQATEGDIKEYLEYEKSKLKINEPSDAIGVLYKNSELWWNMELTQRKRQDMAFRLKIPYSLNFNKRNGSDVQKVVIILDDYELFSLENHISRLSRVLRQKKIAFPRYDKVPKGEDSQNSLLLSQELGDRNLTYILSGLPDFLTRHSLLRLVLYNKV